jgi:peroxiredoxin
MALGTAALVASIVLVVGARAAEGSARVAPSAEEIMPLEVGETVPDVTLRKAGGEKVSLRNLLKEQPAAIVFYRGGWCPYCVQQLQALREAKADLAAEGYALLAISPESPEKLSETTKDKELDYTLLSDGDMAAAKGFGVAFDLGSKMTSAYRDYGATVPDGTLPVPSVFLANQAGEISFVHADADYKARLSNEALLTAARENSLE